VYYYARPTVGNQPGKELDVAGQLLAKGLQTVFTESQASPHGSLHDLCQHPESPAPTADQTATARKRRTNWWIRADVLRGGQ